MISDRTIRRPWIVASPLLLPRVAWAGRGTAFRGQWSLRELVRAMVVVGLCGALSFLLLATAAVPVTHATY
jgi:hypothetical protein